MFVKDSHERTASLESKVSALTSELGKAKEALAESKMFAEESRQRAASIEKGFSVVSEELDKAQESLAEFELRAAEMAGMEDNDWDVDMSKSELPRTWPPLPPHAVGLKTKLVRKFNSLKVRRSQCKKGKRQTAEAEFERQIREQTARIWAVHRRFK